MSEPDHRSRVNVPSLLLRSASLAVTESVRLLCSTAPSPERSQRSKPVIQHVPGCAALSLNLHSPLGNHPAGSKRLSNSLAEAHLPDRPDTLSLPGIFSVKIESRINVPELLPFG